MLIKLIQPRMTMRPMDSIIKPRMAPSLGLLTLATLTPPEHTVVLQDENVRRLTLNDSPDLVAITANVDNALRAYGIAAKYRDRGIPVVGGYISARCPEKRCSTSTPSAWVTPRTSGALS
jgi:hypothetical protein